MTDKTKRLIELMDNNDLTAKDVGDILGRSAQTVLIWRCKSEGRVIPDLALKVLEAEIERRATV